MAELPFHPMIGNLIAILQLSGTIFFGKFIAFYVFSKNFWIWSLAIGMIIISQIMYCISLISELFQSLYYISWLLVLFGFVYLFQTFCEVKNKIHIETPKNLSSLLSIFLCIAYLLLALGPPHKQMLDYHWGVPIYLIRHHHWPPTETWFHGSLAGIGEMYILIGMLLHAENLSTLLQVISLIGFVYWISEKKNVKNKEFVRLFILGVPVLLFFVSGPKPQLFPQVLTSLALYLIVEEKIIEKNKYILIVLLLCGASQQKLSFVLTGGLLGLWATYKHLNSNHKGIFAGLIIVLFFFLPEQFGIYSKWIALIGFHG